MNDKQIINHISFKLLKFIRDSKPSQTKLLEWLGEKNINTFYILLKANLLTVENDVVNLSNKALFDDGKVFKFSNHAYYIDDEIEKIVYIKK